MNKNKKIEMEKIIYLEKSKLNIKEKEFLNEKNKKNRILTEFNN
jgi:hypothetical protein